ncbi:alpha/beta hydrolase family protein [Alicyclobacillus fastidiosus]|uniref:Alpha/beta hydrolase n=1 Tax=Alicyclobacillus fastidiosus TaxID=392011 RepID=A0ABV5A9R1_9BACL|nr:alpha/beta hydrolase [Alicyclobacillus fastidiosus]WEH10933.1 alpha/beta hydrolase [Alicyclobacillus fastidiosus]
MEVFHQLQFAGSTLAMTLHRPVEEPSAVQEFARKCPVVVICHGFVGNRIGVNRLFVTTSRLLEQAGFLVVRFDYAGCGESTGDYGALGLSSMIEQTHCVLDYVYSLDGVDTEELTLLGHSLGGAVAVLTANSDPRVKNLILWSAVAHPFEEITAITGSDVQNDCYRLGTTCYLGYDLTPSYFDSLLAHDPLEAAKHFTGRTLVVHGTSDEEIPVSNCSRYLDAFGSNSRTCRVEVLREADHTYSTGCSSEDLRRLTLDWLNAVRHPQERHTTR